jgi:hypothetical protein
MNLACTAGGPSPLCAQARAVLLLVTWHVLLCAGVYCFSLPADMCFMCFMFSIFLLLIPFCCQLTAAT